jgi:hypothetical protein
MATIPHEPPAPDRSDPLGLRSQEERDRERYTEWVLRTGRVKIVGSQPEPDPEPMPQLQPEPKPTRRDRRLAWARDAAPPGRRSR